MFGDATRWGSGAIPRVLECYGCDVGPMPEGDGSWTDESWRIESQIHLYAKGYARSLVHDGCHERSEQTDGECSITGGCNIQGLPDSCHTRSTTLIWGSRGQICLGSFIIGERVGSGASAEVNPVRRRVLRVSFSSFRCNVAGSTGPHGLDLTRP
jgi:hypothetical protein